MAKVYLPFGYPLIAGASHSVVVYQGNIVRLYIDTPDPRTSSQMENRYLFADIRKMIKTGGEKCRALLSIVFGRRYINNFFSYVKADEDGIWAAAMEEYDDMPEETKEAARLAAPGLATWNDVGKIWWGTWLTVLNFVQSIDAYDFGMYGAHIRGMSYRVDWWTENMSGYLTEGPYDDDDIDIEVLHDTWTDVSESNDIGAGHKEIGASGDNYYQFVFLGRRAMIGFRGKTTLSDQRVIIDNGEPLYMNQVRDASLPRRQWLTPLMPYGFHHVRVMAGTTEKGTLDYIVIYKGLSPRNKVGMDPTWKYNYTSIFPIAVSNDAWFSDSTLGDNILCIGGCNDIPESP